jgi:tRNA1Val (adenine37-N6)-methyltransferase
MTPDDAEGLTRDAFLGGRVTLLQPRRGYRAATDPVLLAAFAPARPGEAVLDLGCGAGAAALCLAARVPGLDLHGLEIQPLYAGLARRNTALNGLALTVHEGDLRAMPRALSARSFDLVLTNPPFHAAAASASPDPGRATAHAETAPLADWIDAALRRLRPGGTLAIVHRAARLGTILAALEGRAGGAEILPLAGRAGRPAGRVLVRARKTSRAPLLLHPPLNLHEGPTHVSGGARFTSEAEQVLRHMRSLLPDTRYGGI